MAKFSPEKKEQLKKDVLEELENNSGHSLVLKDAPIKQSLSKTIAVNPVKPTVSKRVIKKAPRVQAPVLPKYNPVSAVKGPEPVWLDKKENNSKQNHLAGWFRRAVAVILIIILVVVIDLIGIYKFNWRDGFSHGVAKVFSLPAGTVNGQKIKLADYFDNIKILQSAINNDREGLGATLSGQGSANEKIFSLLVVDKLVNEQLKKYNKLVSRQDLDNQMTSIVNQLGGSEKANEAIEQLYNLNQNQFKNKILSFLIAQDNLQEIILKDQNLDINKNAKKKAEEVLRLALQPNVDFKLLAQQYTEDEAGINTGGDLGLISKGEVAPELESIIFSLTPPAVYDKLFVNKIGYNVIKVDEKLTDPASGRESVKVSDILIKVNINEFIKELMDKAVIKKFVQ